MGLEGEDMNVTGTRLEDEVDWVQKFCAVVPPVIVEVE